MHSTKKKWKINNKPIVTEKNNTHTKETKHYIYNTVWIFLNKVKTNEQLTVYIILKVK